MQEITYDTIGLGMKVRSQRWIDTTTMCHYDGYYVDTFSAIKKIEITISKKGEVKKLYLKKADPVTITRETFTNTIFNERS